MSQLIQMKQRKEKGASFIMQDDIARFLGAGGEADYNHPLFDPTIDFILLLKNKFISQKQGMELTQEQKDIPQVYDPEYFKSVNLGAGLEASRRSPEIPVEIRKQMAEYFDEMEGQRQRFSTVDKLADDLENRLKSGKKDKKQAISKSFLRSIIDVIVKRFGGQIRQGQNQPQNQPSQGQQQQTLLGKVQTIAVNLGQAIKQEKQTKENQQTQQPQEQQSRQKTIRFNILRRRNMVQPPPVTQIIQQNINNIKNIETTKKVENKQKQGEQTIDKTKKEFISSAQIDKTVKSKKTHIPPEQQQKIEETKKSDERVSKMNMDAAVKLLHNSGVKATESVVKPVIDKNLENLQVQTQNKPEKQRL